VKKITPYCLHIGSGTNHVIGWQNIDIVNTPGVTDITCDVTHCIPFANDSCQLIYHEHLLEHFDVKTAVDFLIECKRVLMVGGIMRISVPDIWQVVDECNVLDVALLHKIFPELLDMYAPFYPSAAAYLSAYFYGYGHKHAYDLYELKYRLWQSGLTLKSAVNFGESTNHLLCNIDTRQRSLIVEAVKE
jgi:hypothetical protein